ncbi:hypothetical protein PtA15_18A93 [Puccinia triticina]|uniref:Uncharacterized protein n=1 Tax=Puccinia triticina TaxID=208348 RepID=A0ABY7D8P4_9BASI|nr:uncharacterized protein PtA15_18A93 [Puccinia triticina]WAQ93037.1 hypothetical protein PtA15_18A93 [Puccinia triticina]
MPRKQHHQHRHGNNATKHRHGNNATSTAMENSLNAMSFQTTLGSSDSHLTYPAPDAQRRKKFKPSIDPLVQPGHLPEVPLHIRGLEAEPDVEIHSWTRINPEPAVGEYPGQHPIQQPYPHPATTGAAPFARLPIPRYRTS